MEQRPDQEDMPDMEFNEDLIEELTLKNYI